MRWSVTTKRNAKAEAGSGLGRELPMVEWEDPHQDVAARAEKRPREGKKYCLDMTVKVDLFQFF
jgi:hypothetical protein